MYNYADIVRLVNNFAPSSPFLFGTVCAADVEKRLMKVILEPYGVETGWCRIFKGAFTDKIGTEVIVTEIGNVCHQYVVMGIVNDGDNNTSDGGQTGIDYYEDHIPHSSFNGEPLLYTAYWTSDVWRVYTIDNIVMLTGAIVLLMFDSGEFAFCAVVDFEEVQKKYGSFVADVPIEREIYYISTARGGGGGDLPTESDEMKFANNIRIQAIKDLAETRSLMKATSYFDEFVSSVDELLDDIRTTKVTYLFAINIAIVRKAIDLVKDAKDDDDGYLDKDDYDHDDYLCPTEYMIAASNVNSVHKVFAAILSANKAVEEHYGYKQIDATNSNAFYHAYWNALLSHKLGLSKAKSFTDAHEFGYPVNFGDTEPRHKTKMDLINNDVGRNIASTIWENYPVLIDFEKVMITNLVNKLSEQNTPLRRLNKSKTGLIPANGDKDCQIYF